MSVYSIQKFDFLQISKKIDPLYTQTVILLIIHSLFGGQFAMDFFHYFYITPYFFPIMGYYYQRLKTESLLF